MCRPRGGGVAANVSVMRKSVRAMSFSNAHCMNASRQTRPTRSPGFTLVELLLVVVILGILALIAVPTLLKHREKADDAQLRSALGITYRAAKADSADRGAQYVSNSYNTNKLVEALAKSEPQFHFEATAQTLKTIHPEEMDPETIYITADTSALTLRAAVLSSSGRICKLGDHEDHALNKHEPDITCEHAGFVPDPNNGEEGEEEKGNDDDGPSEPPADSVIAAALAELPVTDTLVEPTKSPHWHYLSSHGGTWYGPPPYSPSNERLSVFSTTLDPFYKDGFYGQLYSQKRIVGGYWDQARNPDSTDLGLAVSLQENLAATSTIDTYRAVWAAMPTPGVQSGYQLAWVNQTGKTNPYKFKLILSKWTNGEQHIFQTIEDFPYRPNMKFAIVVQPEFGLITAWTKSAVAGTIWEKQIEAQDFTYAGGYGGIEAVGETGSSTTFVSELMEG